MKNAQFEVENRRRWKGEVVDYDVFKDHESKECFYCLTADQAKLLAGIIEPLAWWTRWQSDTQDIDKSWIVQYKDDIQRRLMMPCCGDEIILFRYDENGNLEVSTDGGVIYTPSPENDIRINPQVQFPEPPTVEGEDKKCVAADGMVNLIREQIGDQLTDDMSRYTLGQLIKDWTTTIIGTSNPFQALVTIVTNQIFALLISAVRAALTSDVYDKLRCILYCNMDDAAFFDGTAWEAVRSQILSEITGIAGVFLEHIIYLIGNGGLSNLARAGAGSATADCSDCACEGTCDIDNWVFGEWVSGVFHDYTSVLEDSRTLTSITGHSYDRGDGVQVISITTIDGVTPCHWSMEFVGASTGQLNLFNDAPAHADTLTAVVDSTGTMDGHNANQINVHFDVNATPYVVTFTLA